MTEESGRQTGNEKRTRLSRDARMAQLIAVAERLFAAQGFEGTSIEDVAREAGVDRALIYQYFESKEGLFQACVDSAVRDLQQRVIKAIEGLSPELDVRTRIDFSYKGVRALFEFVKERTAGWDLLFGAGWSHDRSEPFVTPSVNMLDFIVGIISITHGQAPPALIKATAAQLIGASWAVSLWWRQQDEMSIDEITDHHVRVCLAILDEMLKPADGGVLSRL